MADEPEQSAAGGKPRGRRRSESGEAIRQKIKAVATDMFIRHGYNGVTFLELSKVLDINHSLIHYHFGTKAALATEVLKDFAERGIRENEAIWTSPTLSLFDKFVEARDRMYRRFVLFNQSGGEVQHPTGLVSRFAMDSESLTPDLREIVKHTHQQLDNCVVQAVRIAIARGELAEDAPVQFIMLQISSILFVAGPSARYGWEFSRLDQHFQAALTAILRAYGVGKKAVPAWPAFRRLAEKPSGPAAPAEEPRKRRRAPAKAQQPA